MNIKISFDDTTVELTRNGNYQKTYNVKQGDELIIYLEAEDSLGYIHRCMVHMWKQQNGAVAESRYAGEIIYDSEGNILYGKQFS